MPGPRIFVLTGAGVSAESGLGTFRDVQGLWTQYNLEEVASIDGYERNRALVLDFYNARRRNLAGAAPNPAHYALARLESALEDAGGELILCTQNVDDLHERAGSRSVIHMHGELTKSRCHVCGAQASFDRDIALDAACTRCGRVGEMRPHVVWFGEVPLQLHLIQEGLERAEAFVAIGTSGSVYPAAGFVAEARALGLRTMEINLEPSDNAFLFDEKVYGPASQAVPVWAETLIARI
jgi:NAD-dependent deacetylase